MEEGRAYIESGILELYVLGQLDAHERAEVEVMASKFPEVKEEINAIEIAMEQYALEQSIAPSDGLDRKILERINSEKAPVVQQILNAQPAQKIQPQTEIPKTSDHNQKIIPLNIAEQSSKIRTLRIALVACIALLIISVIALFSAHSELGSAKQQIATLTLDKEKFTSTVNYMKATNADLQKIADMSNDPDWKIVKLAGTKMDPDAKMILYWHVTGNHVMMDNSKMHLPVNDQSHQYQLWALVNGKPVDLGVFDVNSDHARILVKMKEISSAQTFAVTLEKRGGSVNPTMDQMIVAGNVSI